MHATPIYCRPGSFSTMLGSDHIQVATTVLTSATTQRTLCANRQQAASENHIFLESYWSHLHMMAIEDV
jgi:hypothetical protein